MGCSSSKPAEEVSKGAEPDARTERTYGAWAQSEENDEHDFLEAQKTATSVQNKLSAMYPEKNQEQQERKKQSNPKKKGRSDIPDRYTGPHLKAPWTIEQADSLLDFFVRQSQTGADLTHVSYVENILHEGIEIFRNMPSVMKVPVPGQDSGKTLIVVGDTHGQLADVLYIFSVHGPPSPTNCYLFNGDIADRGPAAVEICLLLLSYKLACDECIYINRGNHENADINERPAKNGGGFANEVRSKYDREIFHLFQQFFCALPLATVLGDECLVVHGGLCRLNPTIDQMKKVEREMQCPDLPLTLDETILFDSLWADPAADGEPAGSGRGGVCYSFDDIATSKFLALNGLSLVIRSHQLPPKQRGYMLHHANKVLTIFSASNYCGVCANHGAILILRGGMSEVWEYRAPPMDVLQSTWDESKAQREKEAKKRAAVAAGGKKKGLGIHDIALAQMRSARWGGHARERTMQLGKSAGVLGSTTISDYVPDAETQKKSAAGVTGMDVAIVRQLKERICLHRAELLRAFHKVDANSDGLISIAKWQEIVGETLKVPIDWSLHGGSLVVAEAPEDANGKSDLVDFVKSLERYQIRLHEAYAGWQANVLSKVYTALQKSDLSLDSLKARFDKDADGSVTGAEVLEVLGSFDLALARPQLERALLWMNMDSGASFKASEFIAQLFVMCHDGVPASQVNSPAAVPNRTGSSSSMTRTMSGKQVPGSRRGSVFGDYRGDGTIKLADGSIVDGVTYVSELLTAIVDTDNDGKLSSTELHTVSQQLWHMIDKDGDGYLSYDEFADAVLEILQDPAHAKLSKQAIITRDHAKYLARRIDVCNTGHICFLEFLPLFSAASTNQGTDLQGSNSALIQHICTHIYEQQHALTKAFQFFDKEEAMRISAQDFVQAVAMVGEVISKGKPADEPFTREQIEILASHCPRDENDMIRYQSFLESFVVVDLHGA